MSEVLLWRASSLRRAKFGWECATNRAVWEVLNGWMGETTLVDVTIKIVMMKRSGACAPERLARTDASFGVIFFVVFLRFVVIVGVVILRLEDATAETHVAALVCLVRTDNHTGEIGFGSLGVDELKLKVAQEDGPDGFDLHVGKSLAHAAVAAATESDE